MKNLGNYRKAGEELFTRLHLSTYPVAIKYIRGLEEIPEGISRFGQDRLNEVIDKVFKTNTGRQRARKLYARAQTT